MPWLINLNRLLADEPYNIASPTCSKETFLLKMSFVASFVSSLRKVTSAKLESSSGED